MLIKTRLDNDDHYDGVNKIEYIVIHDTGNGTDSDEANANYFVTGKRNASAHYFIDDDSRTQVVRDGDGAWHCGDGANKYGINNRNSLGIEQCRVNGVVTAKTEANTIELVRQKMKEHNVPLSRVVRHYDASRKNCPASYNLDGKWTRWVAFKTKLAVLTVVKADTLSANIYRVRKAWADAASQIGAFTDLNNAKDCVNKHAGYEAYDINGVQVYPIQGVAAPTAAVANPTKVIQALCNLLGKRDAQGQKLVVDGYPGPRTNAAAAKLQEIDTDVELGHEAEIRAIQAVVNSHIDGFGGKNTKADTVKWQVAHGLTGDGYVGSKSWLKMASITK